MVPGKANRFSSGVWIMEFFAISPAAPKERTACAIVGLYQKGDQKDEKKGKLSTAAQALDKSLQGRIGKLIEQGDVRGKLGDTFLLADVRGLPCERILLVG